MKCNHCGSENVSHQSWGRTEYYVCRDCMKEVGIAKLEPEEMLLRNITLEKILENIWFGARIGYSKEELENDLINTNYNWFKKKKS